MGRSFPALQFFEPYVLIFHQIVHHQLEVQFFHTKLSTHKLDHQKSPQQTINNPQIVLFCCCQIKIKSKEIFSFYTKSLTFKDPFILKSFFLLNVVLLKETTNTKLFLKILILRVNFFLLWKNKQSQHKTYFLHYLPKQKKVHKKIETNSKSIYRKEQFISIEREKNLLEQQTIHQTAEEEKEIRIFGRKERKAKEFS